MDVLELPRPVINFLRTMTKESCRYVLSWDIFGGTDTVTLTLTWKLNDNESQVSLSSKFPQQQQICEDLYIRHNDSVSLLRRRSRRENNTSTLNRIHSSRGISLEGNDFISTKPIHSHQKQISSLERKPITYQQKEESEPIYTNLNNIKYSTNSSPCFQLNKNLPSSLTHTRNHHHHHHRTKKHGESSIRRKSILSTSTISNTSLESKGTNHINNQTDDDDDDILDPWVKHFECSIDDNTIEKSESNLIRTGSTSGKVKFKREPDYI
ncbi:unnamed protein product [Rotaria sordida]|uniref:Uncharacterized protein n=1 Tax=Rotaria sordida TaxID=392033 RepID=A0A815C6E7_9BILA|nr:unnamed protein product [Rotaria sordida]CAF3808170.1 unnamed protein product [Rotaria sordida]